MREHTWWGAVVLALVTLVVLIGWLGDKPSQSTHRICPVAVASAC